MSKVIIGRNVPAGHVPGGFSSILAKPRKRRGESARAICEAANAFLEKRGRLIRFNAGMGGHSR